MRTLLQVFQCQTCQQEYMSIEKERLPVIPAQWYRLQQGPLYQEDAPAFHFFCRLSCLYAFLAQKEAVHG